MLQGLTLAVVSGICNGLFTAPMKLIPKWRWENIWLLFIIVACLIMPVGLVVSSGTDFIATTLARSPEQAVRSATVFGFAWGFGAILFGLSVDRLGVSLANSLVIGLSSGLGSLVPLLLQPGVELNRKTTILLLGVLTFLIGVALCGAAGRKRGNTTADLSTGPTPVSAYLLCIGAGIMSAVFNIGYSLALPIADAGVEAGLSRFAATNVIWLLMLGAGSIPNIVYCAWLLQRNGSAGLFRAPGTSRGWLLSVVMGLLWGGSIFLYGAATPRLGSLGPSIGWPLSLAVGLLVANLMGILLGEWRGQPAAAVRLMRLGIITLLIAIALCSWSASI